MTPEQRRAEPNTRQRAALFYVHRYETKDFGVIIATATANSLIRRGLCETATRRKFARGVGECIRLTDAGYSMILKLEGKTA